MNRKFFHFSDKKEKYKFSLTKDLAEWANEQIKTFTQDKTIEEKILLKNQVPKNILSVPKVDNFIEEFLKERGKRDHSFDSSVLRLHKKVRDIFGPLSKIWEVFYACTEGLIRGKDISIDIVSEYLQQTVILVGQAMNSIMFHRRRAILRALLGDDNKAATWLRTTYENELKENKDDLFGEVVRAKWSGDAKAKNLSLKQFLSPPHQERKKPFRRPSSGHQSSHKEEGRNNEDGGRGRNNKNSDHPRSEIEPKKTNNGQNKRGKAKARLQHALRRYNILKTSCKNEQTIHPVVYSLFPNIKEGFAIAGR